MPVGPRPWTSGRRRAILESRHCSTRTIVDALALLSPPDRPGVLINASGTDAYTGIDTVPATEATPPTDGFLARVCRAWEAGAERGGANAVRVVILRFGIGLGAVRLVLLGRVALQCPATDPNEIGCHAPGLGPWLAAGGLMLGAGMLVTACAIRRAFRM